MLPKITQITLHQRNGALVYQISYYDNKHEIVECAIKSKNENNMAIMDRAAVVSLMEELFNDLILQEGRSCKDEEFLLFLLTRERQSHVRIENCLNVLNHSTLFQIFKSFADIKNYSQLFGTPVSYLPRSASWKKEWGETYH